MDSLFKRFSVSEIPYSPFTILKTAKINNVAASSTFSNSLGANFGMYRESQISSKNRILAYTT